MPSRLKRYQQCGELHFITFSCYDRLPYLEIPKYSSLFLHTLEEMRLSYDFRVHGYVVMPEHVHLVVGEPPVEKLSTALQALKLSVSKQAEQHPFWKPRYYDFNIRTEQKRIEKLRYLHRNPVKRGLTAKPEGWKWSSFRHYATGEIGIVEIESPWTVARREGRIMLGLPMQEEQKSPGAPSSP